MMWMPRRPTTTESEPEARLRARFWHVRKHWNFWWPRNYGE